MSNLSDRIRGMADYFSSEDIAKAVGIPLNIVDGILSGEIPGEILENFNPAKPPDIKVVNRDRIVRSRVIGIVSMGGGGATTLTSSLASLSAQQLEQSVAAVDLNEFSSLPLGLGLPAAGDQILKLPNLLWVNPTNIRENALVHPKLKNLSVFIGAPTPLKHNEMETGKWASVLNHTGNEFSLVWVDCPSSPNRWPDIFPILDFIIIVVKLDFISLHTLWQLLPLIKELNFEDRSAIVVNANNSNSNITISEFRRMARNIISLPILAALPFDQGIHEAIRKGDIYVTSHLQSAYSLSVNEILTALIPSYGKSAPDNKGFFFKLFNKGV